MTKSHSQAAQALLHGIGARARFVLGTTALGLGLGAGIGEAAAQDICQRTVTADIVAIDQPLMFNRLGAANVNATVYALRRDVIHKDTRLPLTVDTAGAIPGQVELRPDRRPRPLVLRVRQGDCLEVKLQNLLTAEANPFDAPLKTAAGAVATVFVDDQPASRLVGFHAAGMPLVGSIDDAGAMVGRNHLAGGEGSPGSEAGSLVAPGGTRSYRFHAEKEGVFVASSEGVTIGSDGNQGHTATGLFGQVIVEPPGARIYRSQVLEEELRLATRRGPDGRLLRTPAGQPILDYEAVYPDLEVLKQEGKAGLPVLNMLKCSTAATCEIVHSEIAAIVAGPLDDGTFPPETYPLESKGRRNPSLPNRLEPFRDFASMWHDEVATAQAFPGFFDDDPVMRYVLEGVRDAFMINYGSGGVGAEIIANRLGVGPMHDCLSCALEEFFLSSFAVGDPATLVDIPANFGLEGLRPGETPPAAALGPKASHVIGASDPSNVHHSYIGDFVKFRNTHVGSEHHVFHLHNHQWLFNPNDDNSNYLDAQTIGPGSGYTYEINFGGSGNRNKSAGDAIYHCHFYPHFSQGMWGHWRIHDVFEAGTRLEASVRNSDADGIHATPWALAKAVPAPGARAYPDGEIAKGVPIPAVVPLPGKAMPVMPGEVTVQPKYAADGVTQIGSNARVVDRTRNPGYPFWIAGIEDVVGQRPPTPVLDMIDARKAQQLRDSGNPLWRNLDPKQADGFDGGLPRHAMQGRADGGETESVLNNLDFSKLMTKAKPVYYPEEGTDLEQLAMAFHGRRAHPSSRVDFKGEVKAADFITNGSGGPSVGAPFHEPCIDDQGRRLDAGIVGSFFGGDTLSSFATRGSSLFNASNPRVYKGAAIQVDAVLNKAGYHFPQQRILALWQDAASVISKAQPPEPLVMRLNTFDCAVFHHTNLVPAYYELDDYQVRTPTDVIGQHMHLPKWDLSTTDGAANGWNYEDGTASPGAVLERIRAIRAYNGCSADDERNGTPACPQAKPHPYFGKVAAQLGGRFPDEWRGARTTTQRWFADPVVNAVGVDRGLGIVFTHDHFSPSTHQQVGLYGTVLTEPAGSRWVHNETGQPLGPDPVTGAPARTDTRADGTTFSDGGPTSWQAAILPPSSAPGSSTVKSETVPPHREFFFEYSDFQHAYEKGVYVGAGPDGLPQRAAIQIDPGNPSRATAPALADTFRHAINPPARKQASPLFPELVVEVAGGVLPGCPARPCPQAISTQDPGVMVVNYRQEPVGLRVYDPAKIGPDGKPGAQADGVAGDLAYALSTKIIDKAGNVTPIVRKVPEMNRSESQLGFWGRPLNAATAVDPGDPFTPMMRTYSGDLVRMKVQAGGYEEEHNASVHGVKWLQGGSAFGRAPNSGWRNAQAAGISEQFTFGAPVIPINKQVIDQGFKDFAYSVDTSMDGWWSGMWGLVRSYNKARTDLFTLPNNKTPDSARIENADKFVGVCPSDAPLVNQEVVAILANDLLADRRPAGLTLDFGTRAQHNGGPLKSAGGTLVYNPRSTPVGGRAGPIHDPTAMLYVRLEDLTPRKSGDRACNDSRNAPGVTKPACEVRLKDGVKVEPLILRAAAGSCVEVTLYNRLPAVTPDLATLATLQGVVKRDRHHPEGSTTFDNNLIRPSGTVGLHPQLMALDVTQDDGANVGQNIVQTVAPVDPATGLAGDRVTYRWYAGDLSTRPGSKSGSVVMVATPVEFGGFGLMPADKVKQGQKSLVGGMVIVPRGASITEDAGQRAQASVSWTEKDPATGATVTRSARDFMLVMAKNLNHRYADGHPVEHLNGEGVGIPEDSQDSTAMALNYGIEPLWFRFGIAPNAPFGKDGYGGLPNAHQAYSNRLTGGADPVTPVFSARPGDEVRLHMALPHSTSRGSTMTIQGHAWQRDPYVCPDQAQFGLLGVCTVVANAGLLDALGNPLVGSRAIGHNPLGFVHAGQESLTGAAHFTFRLPSAGGPRKIPGDYLWRDKAGIGNASGLWGILRVQE